MQMAKLEIADIDQFCQAGKVKIFKLSWNIQPTNFQTFDMNRVYCIDLMSVPCVEPIQKCLVFVQWPPLLYKTIRGRAVREEGRSLQVMRITWLSCSDSQKCNVIHFCSARGLFSGCSPYKGDQSCMMRLRQCKKYKRDTLECSMIKLYHFRQTLQKLS